MCNYNGTNGCASSRDSNAPICDALEEIMALREDVHKAVFIAQLQGIIEKRDDAKLYIYANGALFEFYDNISELLPGALLIPEVEVVNGNADDRDSIILDVVKI